MYDKLTLIILGLVLTILGGLNFRGNLSSIHWYNRAKITEATRKPYGRAMGGGSMAMGGSLLLVGILQLLWDWEGWLYLLLPGCLGGLGLMLYAQFKYNRGIF